MLSWRDDEDVFSKKSPLTKAGSLTRPAATTTAPRAASLRKTDEPTSSRKSMDVGSPGSLGKSNSLLRGPGNAAEGSIGSEGWWHHMDHSQMNEPAEVEHNKSAAQSAGFTPQYGVTGQSRSLWAEEPAPPAQQPASQPAAQAFATTPAAAPASTPAAAPAPAPASVPDAPVPSGDTATTVAEPAPSVTATVAGAVSSGGGSGATVQPGTAGWWTHMDNSILNQLAEAAPPPPGAVRVGERVMGGGFTPQFNVAGGNAYGSIFDRQPPLPQPQTAADVEAAERQVDAWAPFNEGQGCAQALAAVAEDDWTGFSSAPKVA
ncbi:hypothetical protein GPECTOR_56g377 [Gonium pectorale]|uniref:Uncharacterized protein n=1 Tax=Gonium pectorale TaxID=33097 RepID=A0A150G623_GONPE|nr:hypothetical protein GPECTOR_56g377 [Gonium pectorale]|eukprot:KXZ45281.1 hypothetical protein GPECTOR_56g377 [Gonium pectorale]